MIKWLLSLFSEVPGYLCLSLTGLVIVLVLDLGYRLLGFLR